MGARVRYIDKPDFVDQFVAGIEKGMSIAGMARALLVTDTTIFNYFKKAEEQLEENPDAETPEIIFLRRVREAEMKFEQVHLDNIKLAAVNGDWKADAWLLERRRQKEYVVRQEFAVESKEPVTIMMDVKPTNDGAN